MKFLAILCARFSGWILGLLHRGGSYPGKAALSICPDILSRLQIDGEVILVTGTNGKTSTANMLVQSLKMANKSVISNTKGDNMKNGIATVLLKHATLQGAVHVDMAVLEVDELSMPYIVEHLHVHDVVITNFFRDQLDRAKEMEQLIKIVEKSLQRFHGNLILNANDPNTVRFAYALPKAQAYFYGVEGKDENDNEEAKEGAFCPLCGHRLIYDKYQYSHIGDFHCEHCSFQTPRQALWASDVQNKEFKVHFDTYHAPMDSLYMIYNCMAVLCVFDVLHLQKQHAKKAFQQFVMPMGRGEVLHDGERLITLHLVKNPTGANEVLKQIEKTEKPYTLLFVLHDNPQDGTDISWIYDTDFERIFSPQLQQIIVSGKRAHEAGLRMKYGGYEGTIVIEPDMLKALDYGRRAAYDLYVLATYTALAPMRAVIGGALK